MQDAELKTQIHKPQHDTLKLNLNADSNVSSSFLIFQGILRFNLVVSLPPLLFYMSHYVFSPPLPLVSAFCWPAPEPSSAPESPSNPWATKPSSVTCNHVHIRGEMRKKEKLLSALSFTPLFFECPSGLLG